MTEFNWRNLLTELSQKQIQYDQEMDGKIAMGDGSIIKAQLSPKIHEPAWLGCTGATEAQIIEAEDRLGKRFPPSYREFLKVSNGWMNSGWDAPLWSTKEVDWFKVRNQNWIDGWVPTEDQSIPTIPDDEYFIYGSEQDSINLRVEYLQNALEISDYCESDIYLLIPEVIFDDGEWEAWHFGGKLPGATRHQP